MRIDPDIRDMVMCAATAVLLCLAMVLMQGCASTPERVVLPPTEVKVSVAQPCITPDQVPRDPDYRLLTGEHVQRLGAILINREQDKKYIAAAKPALAACVGAGK